MEPKVSMTVYAVAICIAELLFVSTGYSGAIIFWVGVGVVGFGMLSFLRYRWLVSGYEPPKHRRDLDWWVLGQWLGSGLFGIVLGLVATHDHFHPLRHAHPFIHAVIIAATIGAPAVFLSSLVDWYWILPRIGGFGAYFAPCEEGGQEQWARVTSLWLIHRALATAVIASAITAIPLYMVSISDSGGWHAIWDTVAIIFAGAAGIFSRQAFYAGMHAFNPPVHVGDIVQVRLERWDFEPRPVYIVDVAREGSKIKDVRPYDDLRSEHPMPPCPAPVFQDKGDGEALPNEELRRVRPLTRPSPCAGDCCTGVNWYCRNNPRAYSASPKRRERRARPARRGVRLSPGVPRRGDDRLAAQQGEDPQPNGDRGE